jgi:hypothetical protein
VFTTVGDILLAEFFPFAASLYDAITHGAYVFVPHWSSCESIYARMPLGLKADK